MPQDQSQLWDLFALLAQLQKSRLPCVLIQQIGDEVQGPPVLLRDRLHHAILTMCGGNGRGSRVVVSCDAIVVLLLSGGGCGSSSLLGVLMVTLLMHP